LQELFLCRTTTDNYLRVLRETGQLHCLLEAWSSIRQQVRSDKEIYTLDLSYSRITGAGLKELKDLPNLRAVLLTGTRIKAEEFVNLSGVPSLEIVGFDAGMVTDEALRTLKRHNLIHLLGEGGPNRRIMRLWKQPITDEGLKVLREVASLAELDLSGTAVSDAGIKDLKEMAALETLNLRDTRVTNKGLAGLLENKKLKRIDVTAKLIDDETLNLFHNVGRLEALSIMRCTFGETPSSENVVGIVLNNTQVTDEGLRLLKNYPKLRFINVHNSRVTDAGVAELLKTFPNLRVLR
jgi:internalin A